MFPDTTNSWFSRLPWWGKTLFVVGVLILLVTGAGCSALGIPTAETAVVRSDVATSSLVATSPAFASDVQAPSVVAQPPAPDPGVATAPVKLIPATIVRIVDGDTAVFRLAGGTVEKVRFIGIDTPESTTRIEPYGKAASAYASEHLSVGIKVYLEKDVKPRDRYGRLLAYVWLSPPTAISESELRAKLFNAQLAIDGYAHQMTIAPDVKYADYFGTFVAEARNRGRGLWSGTSDSGASGPAAGAAAGSGAGSTLGGAVYIGNRNTKRFHYPSCSSVSEMNPANKVSLTSRSQAIGQGYVSCGRCRP